jgi:hypothetical protein
MLCKAEGKAANYLAGVWLSVAQMQANEGRLFRAHEEE